MIDNFEIFKSWAQQNDIAGYIKVILRQIQFTFLYHLKVILLLL